MISPPWPDILAPPLCCTSSVSICDRSCFRTACCNILLGLRESTGPTSSSCNPFHWDYLQLPILNHKRLHPSCISPVWPTVLWEALQVNPNQYQQTQEWFLSTGNLHTDHIHTTQTQTSVTVTSIQHTHTQYTHKTMCNITELTFKMFIFWFFFRFVFIVFIHTCYNGEVFLISLNILCLMTGYGIWLFSRFFLILICKESLSAELF